MSETDWDTIRKQARHLENDIDMKLIAFNKVGVGAASGGSLPAANSSDTSPLLGDHGYRQEYLKIQANHTTRMEREELLRGSGLGPSSVGSPSTSGLSRRDMYLKENTHLQSSSSLVNDQISIAMETKEHLTSQRQHLKRFQTRLHDISNRFPLISR
ncbi:AGAP002454-PA-like protein [Anopheles sinensis]|uniref:Golgi SNAP receptor complex member 1 n=1 Tax=Anopheles sinensis TaxID=74873 RepID=A0A084WRH2_ANOSI|nr:AGAP002454-PA-like protein [Anopheles sinensis]